MKVLVRSSIAALILAGSVRAQPNYEIYAIKYATLKAFPLGGLVEGEDRNQKLDIGMYVFLVKGGGRNILFDCGFYRPQFSASGSRPTTKSLQPPSNGPA